MTITILNIEQSTMSDYNEQLTIDDYSHLS